MRDKVMIFFFFFFILIMERGEKNVRLKLWEERAGYDRVMTDEKE